VAVLDETGLISGRKASAKCAQSHFIPVRSLWFVSLTHHRPMAFEQLLDAEVRFQERIGAVTSALVR
jgi:hypothetical protein